ncbi:leucine-rich repeat extensin-like protein 2 [Lates japonicus]|uniref:Leucine-rich repeat extensin-like protein 2 n=1 Tax=Lates japonicus TaxID=270547 RepID=A0AAD3REF0_LATJO|nr:leucine-rich repeat extensin-like protein 2 [Lates japonicus]
MMTARFFSGASLFALLIVDICCLPVKKAPALPLQVSPHRLISLHYSQSPVSLNQQYMLALVPPLDLLCPDTVAVQWDIILLPNHHQEQLLNLAHMKSTGLLRLLVSSLVRNSQLMLLVFIPVHLGM